MFSNRQPVTPAPSTISTKTPANKPPNTSAGISTKTYQVAELKHQKVRNGFHALPDTLEDVRMLENAGKNKSHSAVHHNSLHHCTANWQGHSQGWCQAFKLQHSSRGQGAGCRASRATEGDASPGLPAHWASTLPLNYTPSQSHSCTLILYPATLLDLSVLDFLIDYLGHNPVFTYHIECAAHAQWSGHDGWFEILDR